MTGDHRTEPDPDLGRLTGRVAGAPISWGVCEVPGWGHQMPVDRVLAEMAELGLTATELGPDGFLGADAAAAQAALDTAGLRCVGGFVPVVLHEPDTRGGAGGAADPMLAVDRSLAQLHALRADLLVLAADTGLSGYDTRPVLDDAGWDRLLANLDAAADRAEAGWAIATLHPHVGTMIETADDVARVLAGSSIPLCLDTGHLFVGGADPVALAREHADRIRHVHLKDVDAAAAAQVRTGELSFSEAVAKGMFRPLGHGDVDVAAIVAALERAGYDGWYVLEQDLVLTAEPAAGAGPVHDAAASLDHLARVAATVPA